MRWFTSFTLAAVLCGCPAPKPPSPSPPGNPGYPNQFYFPTGLAHVDSTFAANTDGTLFVVNGNFDRRFDRGSVVAVDLSKVGLPAFLAPQSAAGPLQLQTLKLTRGASAQIADFGGELGLLKTDGGVRLFVPTRSELNRFYAIDAPTPKNASDPQQLNCVVPNVPDAGAPYFDPADAGPVDCTPTGQSLTALDQTATGIPRAASPIGIGVRADGQVWVTALSQADSPRGSLLNAVGYMVRVNGFDPRVTAESFVSVGPGATSSVALGSRYAYATGRIYLANTPAFLIRMIDTVDAGAGFAPPIFNPGLESMYTVFEGRGVAVSTDERRVYFASRSPEALIVASVFNKDTTAPGLYVEHAVALPEGADLVTVIPRPGRSDLVAIACSTAGVLAFYDDDVGDLVAQISGVGLQPYAIAVDLKNTAAGPGTGARLYVSNFTDGRIAVIDVPKLADPKTAQIVAFLGRNQLCITRSANDTSPQTCDGGT